MRALKEGEDFPGDKIPAPYTPHKHAALAMRLFEESNKRRAALSAFYGRGKQPRAVTKGKTKAKRS